MCNNIRINKFKNMESVKAEKSKERLEDWIEKRPAIKQNKYAKENRIVTKYSIDYTKKYPLLLHNGTKVYKIEFKRINDMYKIVNVVFSNANSSNKNEISARIYNDEKLDDMERFLENSQSIAQMRNIDTLD